jgi:hypothetical protein
MRFGLITALSATLALVGCGDKDDDGSDGTDDGDDTTPVDADGDGFDASDDCDDTNADINPSAAEACDGLDNNCDGEVDEGVTSAFYGDLDGDGYAGDTLVVEACEAPDGFYAEATDCDDLDATVSPDASEVCDGADNDCDGLVDDDDDSLDTSTQVMVYTDADSDGYGDDGTGVMACAAGSGQSELGGTATTTTSTSTRTPSGTSTSTATATATPRSPPRPVSSPRATSPTTPTATRAAPSSTPA